MRASGSSGPLVNCRMENQASMLKDVPFLRLPFFALQASILCLCLVLVFGWAHPAFLSDCLL